MDIERRVYEYPQILKVSSSDGIYSLTIEVTIAKVSKLFEFPISRSSFKLINKVLSSSPFDNLPGLKYKYYFVPGITKINDLSSITVFRIEQGKDAKNFEFELTNELISNLLWFFQLEKFEDAEYLSIKSENTST